MQVSDERQSLRDRVLGFARDIRIAVREAAGGEQGFLPGLGLSSGVTAVIPAREYPGDMLHEAGYLAVTTLEERATKILTPTPPTRWQRSWFTRRRSISASRRQRCFTTPIRRARKRWRKISPTMSSGWGLSPSGDSRKPDRASARYPAIEIDMRQRYRLRCGGSIRQERRSGVFESITFVWRPKCHRCRAASGRIPAGNRPSGAKRAGCRVACPRSRLLSLTERSRPLFRYAAADTGVLWHDDRAPVCVARRSAALSAYAALAALNFPFPGGPA